MEYLLKRFATPYKRKTPVIEPSGVKGKFDECMVDCPFVFFHNGKYFMMYIGFDGKGYQTALATASSPEGPFTEYAVILPRLPGSERWDSGNAAGTHILSEYDIEKPRVLKKYDGKYWLFYHSYPGEGYEEGPAKIGVCYTTDETLKEWVRLDKPVMFPDSDCAWEAGGLYKECVIEHDGTFYMFYNAKNIPEKGEFWHEETGVATSKDLLTWKKYENNPVLRNDSGMGSLFVSDPQIMRYKDLWLNFYFAFDTVHARCALAWSENLYDWEKADKPLIDVGEPGSLDGIHAHKSCVITVDDVLYHYYCAVGHYKGKESRVIALATSAPPTNRN